jgi:outer membrane protein assembly factor BamB
MSTELERMFTALRDDADAIPLGEAGGARRRGERRRRTQLVAVAAAVACVVAAGVAGGSWLTRDLAGPEPEPIAPPDRIVQLGPPRPLGEEISFGARPAFSLTSVAGERAYASWFAGDQLMVAAADLRTGERAWPAKVLGEFDDSNGIVALPHALLAIGEHNDGTIPDQLLFVVDPDSGAVRWKLPFSINDDDLLFFEAAVVLVTADGTSRGYDWTTGRALWEQPATADRPVMSIGMTHPDGGLPNDVLLAQHLPLLRDPRLLQVTAGGNLLVRDAATGTLTATRAGVAPSGHANYIAAGGRLHGYSLMERTYRLRVTDVDGTGASRDILTGAPEHNLTSLVACGTGRVCVLDSYMDKSQVIALDVTQGRELWRVTAPSDLDQLTAAGTRVLLTGRGSELQVASILIDKDGREVMRSEAQLVWISTGTLLSLGTTEVASVDAADGKVRALGELPAHLRWCSWTETRLACPTPTGFQVWAINR